MPGKSATATATGGRVRRLIDFTLEDVQVGQAQGLFTAVQLVHTYIARIDEVDGKFNAVTEIDPTAIQQAQVLDEERKQGILRGFVLRFAGFSTHQLTHLVTKAASWCSSATQQQYQWFPRSDRGSHWP
jgi:hypothetical protein